MKRKQIVYGLGASMGMLTLILDGETALQGARDGIGLCIRTVIPSLFPFFVLSILLTGTLVGSKLTVLRPIGSLCRIPIGAEPLLLVGLLGGYPVGAQAVANSWRTGQLNKATAERMLGFCNNAGPAFLFGMVSFLFPVQKNVWMLWGIHVVSALFAAVLLPGGNTYPAVSCAGQEISLPAAVSKAVHVMASVCGWIILFRVVISFLRRWILWILPAPWQVALIGILELSNGCMELSNLPATNLRFFLCSGILAFGGFCVTMQTISVTHGLSLKHYMFGKLLQTICSLSLSAVAVYGAAIPGIIPLFLLAFLGKKAKRGSIQAAAGV